MTLRKDVGLMALALALFLLTASATFAVLALLQQPPHWSESFPPYRLGDLFVEHGFAPADGPPTCSIDSGAIAATNEETREWLLDLMADTHRDSGLRRSALYALQAIPDREIRTAALRQIAEWATQTAQQTGQDEEFMGYVRKEMPGSLLASALPVEKVADLLDGFCDPAWADRVAGFSMLTPESARELPPRLRAAQERLTRRWQELLDYVRQQPARDGDVKQVGATEGR